ncbi:MAG: hypothetical protein ABI448_01185 [Bacteroidia bacterium]
MKKKIIPLLVLLLMACAQETKSADDTKKVEIDKNWNTFTQANYEIKYPSNWELDQSGKMGTSFIVFSPLENENDKFKENINLVIQDLTGKNINLDKYTKISEEQIKTMITNSKILESEQVKNDLTEYHKVIYTGDQGIYHLTFEQYYWVMNEKVYIITFTSEVTTFKNYRGVGEKIMNSFVIQNAKK